MTGAKKKTPKLNPDKLNAAKARAKKNAEAARMAEEFAYAVKAAGMFGASASETAAELEAMAAAAKAAEKEAKAAEKAAKAAEKAAEAEAAALIAKAKAAVMDSEVATTPAAEGTTAPVTEEAPANEATPATEGTPSTKGTSSTHGTPAAEGTSVAEGTPADETLSEPETPSVTFKDLGLNSYIIKAISEMGFEKPTPVQARIIPTLLSEEGDVVCLAQTGTGKTAAFGLPSLERIVGHNMERYTQVLVLSPTRELCKQITQDLRNYSKHLHDLQVVDVMAVQELNRRLRRSRRSRTLWLPLREDFSTLSGGKPQTLARYTPLSLMRLMRC